MNRALTICSAIVSGLSSAAAVADYDRAGFQLTGGIGLSRIYFGGTGFDTAETENATWVAINFSVGYGLNHRLSLLIGGMGAKADDVEDGKVASVVGLGASYHFSADPTSFL